MLDHIKSASSAFKEAIQERILSPFTMAFFISWSIFNYELFLVILGDMQTIGKIVYIKNIYFHENHNNLIYWPIASASAYIFIYPIITMLAYSAHRFWQIRLATLKAYFDNESVYTRRQHIEIYEQLERKVHELGEENSNLKEKSAQAATNEAKAIKELFDKKSTYEEMERRHNSKYADIISSSSKESQNKVSGIINAAAENTVIGIANTIFRFRFQGYHDGSLSYSGHPDHIISFSPRTVTNGKIDTYSISVKNLIDNYDAFDKNWSIKASTHIEKSIKMTLR